MPFRRSLRRCLPAAVAAGAPSHCVTLALAALSALAALAALYPGHVQ